MTQKAFIFVLLALVVAGGIYFFSQNRSENANEKAKKSQEVYTDTIPTQTQPSIEERKDSTEMRKDTIKEKNSDKKSVTPTPPPAGEKFAPGTAMIRTTILSVERVEDLPGSVSVRVDEVLGYGSSTPPINKGTELSFDIHSYLKSNPKYESLIQEGSELKMLITSQQGMQMGGAENSKRWALVEFKQ